MVVVVGGNVLHHVKREGDCPGGGNVTGECPDPTLTRRVSHRSGFPVAFCRAMLCISAAYAVMRCLSV